MGPDSNSDHPVMPMLFTHTAAVLQVLFMMFFSQCFQGVILWIFLLTLNLIYISAFLTDYIWLWFFSVSFSLCPYPLHSLPHFCFISFISVTAENLQTACVCVTYKWFVTHCAELCLINVIQNNMDCINIFNFSLLLGSLGVILFLFSH